MTDQEKLHEEKVARVSQTKIYQEKIDSRFSYCLPVFSDIAAMQHVRSVAQLLAKTIIHECPASHEQGTALTKLEECMMYTDLAITRHGR